MWPFRKKESFQKNTISRFPKKERADVLLVYPIWVKKGGRGKLQRMLPPLGILSLASYLEQHGLEVHIVDLHAEEISPDDFKEILKNLKPKFVGITVLSAHLTPANYVASLAKQVVSDCKVIVGGVHAESEPEQMLKNPFIDAVCRGDGEEVLLEFVNGVKYSDIKGLSFRNEFDNSKVIHNSPREVEMNLDKYPFPAYHLIDFDNYFPPVASYKDLPAMNVLMTRGCPGKCTFCNSANTVLRGRSVRKMVDMIKNLRYTYGIRQIYFYDDTFTSNPKIVSDFCKLMIEEKVDVKWICYARGDMFREPIAELMSKAGCHQILIGIETGSEALMKDIGKPIKKHLYQKVVDIAHKYNIEVRASFIVGHVMETVETMNETLQFAMDIDVDFFQVNIMTPYPGTQLFREAKLKNLIIHEDYERYGQNEVVLKLQNITSEDVVKFEKASFHKFFFRPKIILRQLLRLTNLNHIKDLFKVLYIFMIEGYTTHKSSSQYLQKWLDFDLNAVSISGIKLPQMPRLTFESRQDEVFYVEGT